MQSGLAQTGSDAGSTNAVLRALSLTSARKSSGAAKVSAFPGPNVVATR